MQPIRSALFPGPALTPGDEDTVATVRVSVLLELQQPLGGYQVSKEALEREHSPHQAQTGAFTGSLGSTSTEKVQLGYTGDSWQLRGALLWGGAPFSRVIKPFCHCQQ
jgi:hypothetical protein